MRHVLWVDKNIVQKYRKRWIPVSHPLILTGRTAPVKSTEIIGKNSEQILKNEGDDSNLFGKEKGSEKVVSDSTPILGSVSKENGSITGVKRGLEENKISSTAVDDARKRFLNRKKGK